MYSGALLGLPAGPIHVAKIGSCALQPQHGCTLGQLPKQLARHARPERRKRLQVSDHTGTQPQAAVTAERATADNGHQAKAKEQNRDQAEEESEFVWTRNWYPVGIAADLDKRRPHEVVLLGKQLVLWWAPEGSWVAFEDRCPHRLAPLSEGFIHPQNQRLVCAYHGWTFSGDSHCMNIPQADSLQLEDAARTNPRACATAYPARVEAGLVFVWPDAAETRFVDAAASPLPIPPGMQADLAKEDIYLRDLPYSYDVLVENLVDPSHLPISHHGQYGQDQADATALQMKPAASPVMAGFDPTVAFQFQPLSTSPLSLGAGTQQVEFHAPSLIWYHGSETERPAPDLVLYAVPTMAGRCRIFQSIVPRKTAAHAGFGSQARGLLAAAAKPTQLLSMLVGYGPGTPKWVRHLEGLDVDDGDAIILNHQDRLLQTDKAAGRAWEESCFIPTSADRGLSAVRRWLSQAKAERFSPPGSTLPLTRKKLLDRYEQHVRKCPHCSKALKFFDTFHYACRFLAQALCTSALMLFIISVGLQNTIPLGAESLFAAITPYTRKFVLAGAIFAVISWFVCNKIIPRFHYVDYVHSGRHG
ncbi:hypothetical protein WJX72_005578 [[Myrmecia] bisecta]|uniref:Rieske domain-containing protein n=1 Tax=[Myrmecia] bisecta TaxID=41462 RepID=A0AAW1R7S1_9CHLO